MKRGTRWRASTDRNELSASSWLVAELVLRKYAQTLPRYARGELLDLGCGKVPLYEIYRPHVTSTVCVDWADSLHGNQFLDQICDLNEPLPFATGRFDTLIFSDVLEHLQHPAEVCNEIGRVIAPGGHLMLNVPFFYWLHEEPHDYFRYTEFALRKFMHAARMELLLLEPVGGAIEVLADISSKLVVRMPGIGTSCASLIQRAAGAFAGSGSGERLIAKTGKKIPMGYFLLARKSA